MLGFTHALERFQDTLQGWGDAKTNHFLLAVLFICEDIWQRTSSGVPSIHGHSTSDTTLVRAQAITITFRKAEDAGSDALPLHEKLGKLLSGPVPFSDSVRESGSLAEGLKRRLV